MLSVSSSPPAACIDCRPRALPRCVSAVVEIDAVILRLAHFAELVPELFSADFSMGARKVFLRLGVQAGSEDVIVQHLARGRARGHGIRFGERGTLTTLRHAVHALGHK